MFSLHYWKCDAVKIKQSINVKLVFVLHDICACYYCKQLTTKNVQPYCRVGPCCNEKLDEETLSGHLLGMPGRIYLLVTL